MKKPFHRVSHGLSHALVTAATVILTGCGGETGRAAVPTDIESTAEFEADSFNDSPQVGGPAQSMVPGGKGPVRQHSLVCCRGLGL